MCRYPPTHVCNTKIIKLELIHWHAGDIVGVSCNICFSNISWIIKFVYFLRNFACVHLKKSQYHYFGMLVGRTERLTPSWSLQMSWRQIGARPSTTTMLFLRRLQTVAIHITHAVSHAKYIPHLIYSFKAHWSRDKMATIFQMTFSNAFSWIKMYKFRLIFDWSLFPSVQSTIFRHWFRLWFGAVQATSHYLNQWCLVYWHIYMRHSASMS